MAELSLRDAYQHVVRADDASGVISLDAFFLRPQGVRHAIEMMVPGPSGWGQVAGEGNWGGQDWTEECQGVASDGHWWFFCSGGSKRADAIETEKGKHLISFTPGGSPMAIYSFALDSTGGSDSNARHIFVMADVVAFAAGSSIRPRIPMDDGAPSDLYHFGALIVGVAPDAAGTPVPVVFVDHFARSGEAHVLVLRNDGGVLSFLRWIALEQHPERGRMGMVAWIPEGDCFVTSHGDKAARELYMHRMDGSLIRRDDDGDGDKNDTPRSLQLAVPIHDWMYVQGGAWSPNGHLYVSAGATGCTPHQFIYNYSILTGRSYPTIDVLALEADQELEGICLMHATWRGIPCQIHAILLNNDSPSTDDIFFKSFAAAEPDRV